MTEKPHRCLRVGMVGMGMIFEETYRPAFEKFHRRGLWTPETGPVGVELVAVASKTGTRAEKYRQQAGDRIGPFVSVTEPDAVKKLLEVGVDVVCIATPDDRHYPAARLALAAGKHVLIEKPSVLRMQELDELLRLAEENDVLAKVVYHKLFDPDHKRLRTLVVDNVLRHVNHGYCSLLEPKQISAAQFAEWIRGRNPGTYVAVHYVKLIDFTFFHRTAARLARVSATGQRGLVAEPHSPTWDSVQLRIVYTYPDDREAAFDIHTSWVNPDNFPGYVEQEVQFRFDNAVWNAHQRKRGVEVTIEGKTPFEYKITPNHHYNATFLEPWGERCQRGYGIEAVERFFEEVAYVEFGGPKDERALRLSQMRALAYNDLTADRNTVAVIHSLETILARHVQGEPDGVVYVNHPQGGLVLAIPGKAQWEVLYEPRV